MLYCDYYKQTTLTLGLEMMGTFSATPTTYVNVK